MPELSELVRERTLSWTLITESQPPSDEWVLFTLKRAGKFIVMPGKFYGFKAAESDNDHTFCCGVYTYCIRCCHETEGTYSLGISPDEVMSWMPMPEPLEYDVNGDNGEVDDSDKCACCCYRDPHGGCGRK